MVYTCVKQIPVMRYKYEPLFSVKIILHYLSRLIVQMISRLINQKKLILPGKQYRKHQLSALTKAQLTKRSVQKLRRNSKLRKLAQNPPALHIRFPVLHQLIGRIVIIFLRNLVWKIVKYHTAVYRPAVLILSRQKI